MITEFKTDIAIFFKSILKLKINKKILIIVFITMIASNILSLIIPLLLGNIINGIINKSLDYIKFNLIYMILIFIISSIMRYINTIALTKITYDLEIKMKKNVFDSILRVPHNQFITIDKGRLINNIEQDANVFSALLSDNINNFMNVISMLISFVFMIYICPILTIILLISFPITTYIFILSGKKLKEKEIIYKKNYDKFFSFINETLYGWKILKAFGAEEKRTNIFKEKTQDLYKIQFKKIKIELLSQILISFISFFINIINILIAIYLIFTGNLTLGMFTAFNEYSENFKSGLLIFSTLGATIQQTIVSIDRVDEILRYKDEKKIYSKANKKVKEIKINDLSYSTNENKLILKNININFKERKIYLIKGESGSGKTTLFNILSNFINNYEGEVLFNNTNLKEIENKEIRKKLIYVTQENYLFSISIKENISLYRDIDIKIIENICKKLNIHHIIMKLPQRYDTVINEKGINLSGGEIQRVCIARAIVTNPDIYLFDEITSAIDEKNSKEIIKVIEEISKKSIVIMTSHEKLKFSKSIIEYDLNKNFIREVINV
ncbi:MAG: ABC transporter ATP-binding protein [Sarcina sp.]